MSKESLKIGDKLVFGIPSYLVMLSLSNKFFIVVLVVFTLEFNLNILFTACWSISVYRFLTAG